MRVLYLSQYFPPENTASSYRAHTMAKALTKAGHQVTVIAEMPNHPQGIIWPEFRGKLIARQEVDGLDVIYVWIKASSNKRFRHRILFYMTYMFMAVLAASIIARGRYDLVFATSPPLFVGLAGIAIKFLRRCPLVFEAIDLWPSAAVAVGELNNPRFIGWATKAENACYRYALIIIVTAQEMVDSLVTRGISPKKIFLIRNGADKELFRPNLTFRQQIRNEFNLDDQFVVLYAGLHGLAYDLLGLVQVAQLLREYENIHFLLVGDGVRKRDVQNKVEKLALNNMSFLPVQSRSKVAMIFAAADVMLVPMMEPHIVGTLPVKIYDAMSSCLPVIIAAEGEPCWLVETSNAGISLPPQDYEAMKEAILTLHGDQKQRDKMGHSGRKAILESYSINIQSDKFVKTLESVKLAKLSIDKPSNEYAN